MVTTGGERRVDRGRAPRSRRCSWSTPGSRSSTRASTSSTATTSPTRGSRSPSARSSRGCRSIAAPSARASATSGPTPTPGRSARPSTCCCASSRCARAATASSSGPARSAGPACSATSTSARRPASAGSRAEEHRRIVDDFCDFMAGNTDGLRPAPRAGDVRRLRGAGLRAGGPPPRRPGRAAAGRWRSRRSSSATAPTPTSSPSPRTRSRRRSRSSTSAAGGSAASAAGSSTASDDSDTAGLVEQFLLQLYGGVGSRTAGTTIPREVLVPALPPDAACPRGAAERAPRQPGRHPGAAARRQARRCWRPSRRNAAQSLVLHKTKRASDLTTRNRALEEIQEALGLDEAPLRIECYDVSNLQGTEVVASMVVFEDGLPRKSEYRRFVIRGGRRWQNDVAHDARGHHPAVPAAASTSRPESLRARRERRRSRLPRQLADPWRPRHRPETGRRASSPTRPTSSWSTAGRRRSPRPSRRSTSSASTTSPVCGLAKRLEEVWLPDEQDPVILARAQRGALPAPAGPRRGPPLRHHLPPAAALQGAWSRACSTTSRGWARTRRKTLLKHFGSLKRLPGGRRRRGRARCPASVRAPRPRSGGGRRGRPRRRKTAQPAGQHRHGELIRSEHAEED